MFPLPLEPEDSDDEDGPRARIGRSGSGGGDVRHVTCGGGRREVRSENLAASGRWQGAGGKWCVSEEEGEVAGGVTIGCQLGGHGCCCVRLSVGCRVGDHPERQR
eukprot:scaffold1313_cov138-Isochrysis_galbana.AAC.4